MDPSRTAFDHGLDVRDDDFVDCLFGSLLEIVQGLATGKLLPPFVMNREQTLSVVLFQRQLWLWRLEPWMPFRNAEVLFANVWIVVELDWVACFGC